MVFGGVCVIRDVSYLGINDYKYAVECRVRGRVLDSRDAVNVVEDFLTRQLGVSLDCSLRGREVIGARFILYKIGLGDKGECRVIVDAEKEGEIQRIICLLKEEAVSRMISSSRHVVKGEGGYSSLPRGPVGVVDGLPRGQRVIPRPVVYAVKGLPRVDLGEWRLWVEGLVERRLSLSYGDLLSMELVRVDSMFHCVTGWSIGKRGWEGVPLRKIAGLAGVKSSARWVFVESLDGYTTIIPLEDFLHPQSLLVLRVNGEPLSLEHGFPARIFIPHLYGWKHAKWVKRIVFREDYVDGYWEALGYHERGNAWLEERFKGV